MGDGPGEIRSPAAGERLGPPRNLANYRITDRDRLGEGSLKQKFRDNVAAIRTLRRLEVEKRTATDDEKAVLVRYVGWGGLPQVFDVNSREWFKEQVELSELLTDDEHTSARASTLNAHYTSPVVIRGIYAALRRYGFEHGRILEPALGLGHFVGLMPDEMQAHSTITGVEIDSLTARIAKALYPDADVRHQPFEEAKLADGFYDVAISNIPFGDYQPFDPRFNVFKFPIHDYFFAAGLEKVRPGGLILFVTSKGMLDKEDSTLREYLADRANFIGAIRLPNNAFRRNANTEVTTDIVMLRKLNPGEAPSGPAWKETAEYVNTKGETIYINEYFMERPHLMLGAMELSGRMYRDNEPTLVSDGRDLADALEEAVESLPQSIYRAQKRAVKPPTLDQTFPAPDHVKPNAFVMVHGDVAVRVGDSLKVLPGLPSETKVRIRRLIRVRDAVRECLRSQLNGSSDADIVTARELLNQAYDSFVARYGPISNRANTRAFDGDPDLPLLLSLEVYDEETKRATKTAIFRERTIHHQKPVESVATPQEALIVSLNEKGCVDLEHMSALLCRSPEEFLPQLQGTVFLNPQTSEWETEDQYLSGNVREKLEVAEAASLNPPSAFTLPVVCG